jgi:hypothetical protein
MKNNNFTFGKYAATHGQEFNLPDGLVMTEKGLSIGPYQAFRNQGWTDEQLIDHGYATGTSSGVGLFERLRRDDMENYRKVIERWCAYARGAGYVITIEQVPCEPLAMGNHRDVVTVRDVRK